MHSIFFRFLLHKNPKSIDHTRVLRHVCQTLRQSGVKLKQNKCVFIQLFIKYLGHFLNGNGFRPDPDNVEAVVKATPTTN